MKLEEIGFYTLSDERAANVSLTSALKRCELILTSRCNFKCPYCRGMTSENQGDMSFEEATRVVDEWSNHNIENIRFSGGEPTLWPRLPDLVRYAKMRGVRKIALSTNGSSSFNFYLQLILAGVDDFSISLDSCCSSTGNKMAGDIPVFDKVVSNIKALAGLTYVTVGVVLTEENKHELKSIVDFASSLGVADIRIIPAAQLSRHHDNADFDTEVLSHPILKYRVRNFLEGKSVRGLTDEDNHQCPLVIDDMAVLNGNHYPCIIYMREQGSSIGKMTTIKEVRKERFEWFKNHNCFEDPICRNNCLDVCVDYNNKVRDLNPNIRR